MQSIRIYFLKIILLKSLKIVSYKKKNNQKVKLVSFINKECYKPQIQEIYGNAEKVYFLYFLKSYKKQKMGFMKMYKKDKIIFKKWKTYFFVLNNMGLLRFNKPDEVT